MSSYCQIQGLLTYCFDVTVPYIGRSNVFDQLRFFQFYGGGQFIDDGGNWSV